MIKIVYIIWSPIFLWIAFVCSKESIKAAKKEIQETTSASDIVTGYQKFKIIRFYLIITWLFLVVALMAPYWIISIVNYIRS